jgi:diguanylate cyclase (GGDEF)-like protein/PAS domain S-box-containing protein
MAQPAKVPPSRIPAFIDAPSSSCRAGDLRSFVLALAATSLAFLVSRGLRSMAGNIAPIWLSDAVLLAQLMVARPRQRYWVLAGGLLGELVANVLVGRSPWAVWVFSSADILEVLIASAFCPSISTVAELIRPNPLVRFLIGGVLLAPILSGLFATALLTGQPRNFLLPTLAPWFISDGLSLAIITPVAVAFWSGEITHLLRADRRMKTAGLLLLVGVVTLAVVGTRHRFPLLYWVFPPLVLLAFQADLAAVLIGLLLCMSIALWFTLNGQGPFWAYPFASMQSRIFALQLFWVAASGITLPISATQAQRNRLMARLSDGERRYRLLAENATDIVMSMGLDGRLIYVSPRANAVLGYHTDLLVGTGYQDLVEPEDRAALAKTIERLGTGTTEACQVSRIRRSDGQMLWMETYLRAVIDPFSGKPEALTATVRDITDRKAAEQRLAAERNELRGLAFRDGLTGLFNRRHFDRELELRWGHERLAHSRSFLAIIMIDIDFYKSYNDHYGHRSGDDCLCTIARTIVSSARRPADIVARYGGEEFALILSDTDQQSALAVAERIRQGIENLAIPNPACGFGIVTISLGVATQRPDEGSDACGLVVSADRALYAAKRHGRNRTWVAELGADDSWDLHPLDVHA